MNDLRRFAILAMLAATVGCGGKEQEPPAVRYFKEKQASAYMTRGRVLVETVREAGEGVLVFATEQNGKQRWWRVKYRKWNEGDYEYREVEPLDADATGRPETPPVPGK